MNWIVLLLFVASLYGAWNWWSNEREIHRPPGILAAADPIQEDLATPTVFEAKAHTFHARARFDITARVLRKEIYRIDGGANLAPVDLGLGWGAMSDSRVIDKLSFSQMGRFLYWRVDDWVTFPLSPRDMTTHAGQVHAIPSTGRIERQLRRLRPGDVVTLSGYLVDVRGPGGFVWNTSLRRDDTGDGACEIMWIERLTLD